MITSWDADYHRRLDRELVNLAFLAPHEQAAIRRELCRYDPVAFARIYFHDHLVTEETNNLMSFATVHYDWARLAQELIRGMAPEPMADRHAEIAPRGTGKTTWWFLIIPCWAAAYGWTKFAAAFAHAAAQSETHLKTFKHELDNNALLRHDFPELCTPLRKQSGTTVADNMGMIRMANGFIFAARGIDAASLGLKVGKLRPDLLILDDVEPDEASYSPDIAKKRLGTITDAVLPLNIYARVVLVGTVTMPGSIMHQLVKSAHGKPTDAWVAEEKIQAHHYRPIAVTDEGLEYSIWPEKWPLAWLLERRHTREYAKNYDNDPLARDGVYWRKEDFKIWASLPGATRTLLAVDPAVTARKTSDFTGLAVIEYSPSLKKARVLFAIGVRLTGTPLRNYVTSTVLGRFPEISLIFTETNQGGDLWAEVFGGIPGVRYRHHHAVDSKEIRFARNLRWWQRGHVGLAEEIPVLMEQAVAFPNGQYDDVIDAVVAGVDRFLAPDPRARHKTESYV